MKNPDSLSQRLREPKSHFARLFNSVVLFALLTTGVAGCSDQPTAETGGQSMPVAIDLTVPPGSAVPLPDYICAVTGRSLAAKIENIPQDLCSLDLMTPSGTELNPEKIDEARRALRKRVQDEDQKLLDDAEFEQERRAEIAIALANVPTPTPIPVPTRIVIQAVPTPAKPIPGDEGFKSEYFNAPIPAQRSAEELAREAALIRAFAVGPGAMLFGLPPTNTQAELTMPPLRSLLDPFATAQPVAGTSTQALAQPAATEISTEKPLSGLATTAVDRAGSVQQNSNGYSTAQKQGTVDVVAGEALLNLSERGFKSFVSIFFTGLGISALIGAFFTMKWMVERRNR